LICNNARSVKYKRNLKTFKKWLEERFVPYLGSEFVVVGNANFQIGLLYKISCNYK
jgi:hypothetical protein